MSTTAKIVVPTDVRFLEIVGKFVSQMAKIAGFRDEDVSNIELAVDEACTNVVLHAYEKDDSQSYSVTCMFDDVYLSIEVKDRGQPFNFNAVPEPDVQASIENREVGGLGIYLIRQIMDEVTYNQEPDGLKRLFMKKKISIFQ